MEVSFSLTYKEGNEIRVSLSSFTDTAIPDLIGYLGDAEIVEVSLVRQCGEDMADLATLSKVVERIGKFLIENPHVILYYYCDEMNEIPGMSTAGHSRLLLTSGAQNLLPSQGPQQPLWPPPRPSL